jgi:hypothetical protein
MRRSIRASSVAVIVIGLAWFVRVSAQEAPPKHDSLKVLERFAGTWEQQIALKQGPWAPEAKSGTGTMTAKWTLDGRFMEIRSKSQLDGTEGLSVMGHDMTADALRGWFFHSHGFTHVSTGTWDEKTKTLTWAADMGNGMKMTSVDKFTDDDHFEWQFQIKDGQGQVMFEMSGKATRQKK